MVTGAMTVDRGLLMEPDINVRTFTLNGKEYEFAFTVGKMRAIKQRHGIDMMDFSDGASYKLALSDELFLNVAADALGVEIQDLDSAGPTDMRGIREAFWGALAFFFQTSNPTKWKVLLNLFQQTATVAEQTIENNVKRLTGSGSGPPAATSGSSPGTAP